MTHWLLTIRDAQPLRYARDIRSTMTLYDARSGLHNWRTASGNKMSCICELEGDCKQHET